MAENGHLYAILDSHNENSQKKISNNYEYKKG